MDDTDSLEELDFTVITITRDADGNVAIDSDVGDAETLWLFEMARLMLLRPDLYEEEPDDDDDEGDRDGD